MKFDLNTAEMKSFPNFKGGEGAMSAFMYFDGTNRILNARLTPGSSIGEHLHDSGSEIMFFTSGEGKAVCDGVEETLCAGVCHYCPKSSRHTVINTGNEDLCFYAVVAEQ